MINKIIKVFICLLVALLLSFALSYQLKNMERAAVREYVSSDNNPARDLYDNQGRRKENNKPLSHYAPVVEAVKDINDITMRYRIINGCMQLILILISVWATIKIARK